MTFNNGFLTLSECIDGVGSRLDVRIVGIVHEGSDEVILQKGSKA